MSSPKNKTLTKSNASSPHMSMRSPKYLAESMSPSQRTMTMTGSMFSPNDSNRYHNLSSSVLQHSTSSFKFPQADRFPPLNFTGPNSYCNSPSSLSKKTTGMGFGGRIDVSLLGRADTKSYPSPDRYTLRSEFEKGTKRGKSFGLSYSYYEKMYYPENTIIPPFKAKELPGPGTYDVETKVLPNMNKMTLRPKLKMFNEIVLTDSPVCNKYSPKAEFVMNSRFAKPTFGFGEKSDFTKAPNANPGPGAYSPPSFVDKFKKKRNLKRALSP